MFWGLLVLIALLLAANIDGRFLNFVLIYSAGLITGTVTTFAICLWLLLRPRNPYE